MSEVFLENSNSDLGDEVQLNGTFSKDEKLNGTFDDKSGGNYVDLLNQGSRTITRPPRMQEMNSPNATGSLNNTRTIVRERQKTMVVESQLVCDIRKLLSECNIQNDDFVRRSISVIQKHENDFNGRIIEAKNASKRDLMLYDHVAKDLRNMLTVSLEANGNMNSTIPGKICNGDCDSARKLRLDLDSAAIELDKLHKEYSKLYDVYAKSQNIIYLQKKEYIKLEGVLNDERVRYKKMMEKFVRLREDAQRKLEQASQDMVAIEAKHDEDTKGLRLKVKKLDLDLISARRELENKNKEVLELRDMLNTLVTDLGETSDVESER